MGSKPRENTASSCWAFRMFWEYTCCPYFVILQYFLHMKPEEYMYRVGVRWFYDWIWPNCWAIKSWILDLDQPALQKPFTSRRRFSGFRSWSQVSTNHWIQPASEHRWICWIPELLGLCCRKFPILQQWLRSLQLAPLYIWLVLILTG
jgi:hypothetical protein